MTTTLHCRLLVMIASYLISAISTNAAAATLEEAVKAGFVYNFTKFVQWPATAHASQQADFDVCVAGQDALLGSLEALYGKTANGKPIMIKRDAQARDFAQCDILYIAAQESGFIHRALQAVSHLPVLTISDYPDFIEMGGMIGFRPVDQHIGFEINAQAAQLGGLQLSAQLLKLAKKVKVAP